MTYQVKCKQCKQVMSRDDWNIHQCPYHVKPIAGESFTAYSKRCKSNGRWVMVRFLQQPLVATFLVIT